MTNLEPLWRRMAGELYRKVDVFGVTETIQEFEKFLSDELAAVLGAAQAFVAACDESGPISGEGYSTFNALRAELERLLKGEK